MARRGPGTGSRVAASRRPATGGPPARAAWPARVPQGATRLGGRAKLRVGVRVGVRVRAGVEKRVRVRLRLRLRLRLRVGVTAASSSATAISAVSAALWCTLCSWTEVPSRSPKAARSGSRCLGSRPAYLGDWSGDIQRDMTYLGSGEFCFVFPYGSMRARRAGSDAKPCKSSGRRFGSRTQTSVSSGQEAAPMLRCTASGSTASCNAASCGPLGMSIQTWARSRGRLRAGAAARLERLRAAQAAARAPS